MNLLDKNAFPSMEEFVELYGGNGAPPTVQQIQALQVSQHLSQTVSTRAIRQWHPSSIRGSKYSCCKSCRI